MVDVSDPDGVSSCLALLWVAGSFAWRWLRRTGPLRLAGEATALAEGAIVGFGRPELDEEELRTDPWKEPRGQFRWRYEFEVIDPSGQRQTYSGEELVSRRFPADAQAAMTVGRPAEIRYAVADPTRSELLRLL